MESNRAIDKYMVGVQKFYPGFKFASSTGVDPNIYELEIAFNQQAIAGTEYKLAHCNHLIHYTSSIQNIIEILYSSNLRLQNLVSLNDPQELSFIINYLKLEQYKGYIENFKTTYFSASFCKVEDYKKPDEFAMWRLYGGDGFGCAIVFELEQYETNWIDFMIGEVQYGECQSLKKFGDFIRFLDLFKQQNNFPNNVPITIPALMAFHKNDIWNYEKEVRLLNYRDYDYYTLKVEDYNVCELKHSIDKNHNKCSFVELPLKCGKQYNEINKRGLIETFHKLLPTLKIKKIVLGYQIKPQKYMVIQLK